MLTHVQFDSRRTTLYLGFADDRLTSVSPMFSSFLRTISAFCPDTSGMVSCDDAAAVVVATWVGGAAGVATAYVDCGGWVTVTVDGAAVLV